MFSPEVRKMKRECWQSPWRAVIRNPETDMPERFLRLTVAEMHMAAVSGKVGISEPKARRYGLLT